jgi:hypothetical protein
LWDEDRQKMVSFASISAKDLHKDKLTAQLVTKSLDEAG